MSGLPVSYNSDFYESKLIVDFFTELLSQKRREELPGGITQIYNKTQLDLKPNHITKSIKVLISSPHCQFFFQA
jgi:hypothetical protein